jgi:hypothetical protein
MTIHGTVRPAIEEQKPRDPAIDLVASVFRLAVRDAQRGDAEAIEFLWATAPDWAERLGLPPQPRSKPESVMEPPPFGS